MMRWNEHEHRYPTHPCSKTLSRMPVPLSCNTEITSADASIKARARPSFGFSSLCSSQNLGLWDQRGAR